MTLKEAYEKQRLELIALRRENQKLKDGTFTDKERAALEKEIRHLKWELANVTREKERYYLRLKEEKKEVERLRHLFYEYDSRMDSLKDKIQKLSALLDVEVEEKQDALQLVEKLKRQISRDYENSSIPSSDKPFHKKIKNSREKTGRKPGAQPGHKAQPRKKYTPTEPIQEIPVPEHVLADPDYYLTGKIITKQVIDIEIKTKVTEYRTAEYRNRRTGIRGHAPFPEGIHDEVCYGVGVKAFAFLLNNYCNVSIDKTRQLIRELTGGSVNLSKGMINRLPKVFSQKSTEDRKELFDRLTKAPVLYSDATGCRINGKGAYVIICATPSEMQYYYRQSKGHAGIKGTPVEENQFILVHDHDKTYYSYGSDHQECLAHVLRYLKDSMENEKELKKKKKMHEFLSNMIHEVKQAGRHISEQQACIYEDEYTLILEEAMREYKANPPSKYYRDGYNLAKRMLEYKHNHLLFLRHPEVEYTDNLSERLLRVFKRKMKQAVTFRCEKTVEYLCDALGVIETSRAKGINIYEAVRNVYA